MSVFERIYLALAMVHDRRNEKGAAMVEYALLVAGMAIVVAAAVLFLGSKITALIDSIDF